MKKDDKTLKAKMKLFCVYCGAKRLDMGKFGKKPHRWHLYMKCGKKFWIPRSSIGV